MARLGDKRGAQGMARLAAGGVHDGTIQEIAGWMSPKMIKKYSHVRAEAMRKAVSVFDNVVANA
jgi:hypothetical protein